MPIVTGALPFVAVSATTGKIASIGYEFAAEETHETRTETNDDASDARDATREATTNGAGGYILRDWQVMQTRLDREEEAETMRELWRNDAPAWLERSKTTWRARHLARQFARERASGNPNPKVGTTRRDGDGDGGSVGKQTRKNRSSGEPLVQLGERGRAGLGKVACSIEDLLASGLLVPGKEKLYIVYQDNTWCADLDEKGLISFRGKTFTSPSAWAIFAKRITNPTKKADDGWKSARYGHPDGPTLDQVKGEYARMQQLKAAGIEVSAQEAGKSMSGSNRAAGDSPSPRSTPRKRKASDVVTASADDMTWTHMFPGCEHGAPEPYAGKTVDSNMEFSSLIGRYICVHWERQSVWMAGKVIKVRDLDTHVEADVLFASGKIEHSIDMEELAGEGSLVVLDVPSSPTKK